MSNKLIKNSPWFWIPSLYFAEGVPYFIVNQISIIMFTNMGVEKTSMAFFTSILYLPWVIKPFWSPFVDILRTKRWWVIAMQALMAIAFGLLSFSFPNPQIGDIANNTTPISTFTITMLLFMITAFASATHDIAADGYYLIALSSEKQTFFVGIRSTFYRLSSWFGQGVLVILAGYLETYCREHNTTIALAWRITLVLVAIMFALLTLYHTFFLTKAKEDKIDNNKTGKEIINEFIEAFRTFFKKKQILLAIAFLLFFRLPEALMLKLVYPFFNDSVKIGGLGLSPENFGLIYGTIGMVSLTLGGIIGGIIASKYGLKKVLWPMVAFITIPCSVFVYLSIYQPTNLWLIGSCIAVEQFGYGLGFQAYLLYMMYFSKVSSCIKLKPSSSPYKN